MVYIKYEQSSLLHVFILSFLIIYFKMGSTASSVAPSKYATIFASSPQDPYTVDIEQKAVDDAHLLNDTVRNFAWSGITVTVKDHKTKRPKDVLRDVSGFVEAGEYANSTF